MSTPQPKRFRSGLIAPRPACRFRQTLPVPPRTTSDGIASHSLGTLIDMIDPTVTVEPITTGATLGPLGLGEAGELGEPGEVGEVGEGAAEGDPPHPASSSTTAT